MTSTVKATISYMVQNFSHVLNSAIYELKTDTSGQMFRQGGVLGVGLLGAGTGGETPTLLC